ncbi:MAG: redoxin domain-containing protein [Chloroflexi bacterium]|nr:redoxin domain-containing protein [Chloroflexota bacterium]
MSKFNLVLLLIVTALVIFAACRPAAAPGAGSQRNRVPAPDFSLERLDGQTVKLSDLRGRPVLLNFWTTWCLACKEEMPLLQAIHEEREKDGLVVLGVDLAERPAVVKQFMDENRLTFTTVLDRDNRVSATYGIRLIPTTVLVDRNGDIRDIKVGAFTSRAEIRRAVDKIME